MKTDEQLKAAAFDKYLAAADAADSDCDGINMKLAAQTLKAVFTVEKIKDRELNKY